MPRAYLPSPTALAAEFVGTFTLMFLGLGAIMLDAETGWLSRYGVSVAWGVVIVALVIPLLPRSGAHFNSAVTVSLAAMRLFPWRSVPAYIATQLVAALAAALALRAIAGNVARLGGTLPSGSVTESFIWEVALTAGLMSVIAVVALRGYSPARIAVPVGAWVALAGIVGGPISGASMNPPRSVGPAIASGELQSLWIYLTAPLIGGIVGGLAVATAMRRAAHTPTPEPV